MGKDFGYAASTLRLLMHDKHRGKVQPRATVPVAGFCRPRGHPLSLQPACR